ncbi:MAG: hypothetical protein Q9168_003260 [Polycauliona sp. 1 TL-2023]
MPLEDSSTSSKMPPAHIFDFPDELLLQIVAHLTHEDLENFSSSCKRINNVSLEAMTLHLELKYLYPKVESFQNPTSYRPFASLAIGPQYYLDRTKAIDTGNNIPLKIINDVLDNEGVLGSYVRELTLRDTSRSSEEEQVVERTHLSHEVSTKFGWYKWQTDDSSYMNLLLLACTRLQSLKLCYSSLSNVSRFMSAHNSSDATGSQPAALQGLKTVSLGQPTEDARRERGGAQVDWNHIYPFAGLPSIHTIKVRNLGDTPKDRGPAFLDIQPYYRYRFPPNIASLAKLELSNSLITGDGLALLLEPSKPNSLTHFIYDVNPGPDHKISQYDWDPRSIIRVLRNHTLESLTHLTITGSPHNSIMGQRSCGGFIGSLTQFTKLQHIELECYILIFKRRYKGKPILSTDKGDDCLSSPPSLPILELLPRDLETLTVVKREQCDVQMERMLEGVVVGCEALPRLKQVVVKPFRSVMPFATTSLRG